MTSPATSSSERQGPEQRSEQRPHLDESRVRFGANLASALFSLAGGLAAYGVGAALIRNQLLNGPNNVIYLTVVGLLVGYLFTRSLARRAGRLGTAGSIAVLMPRRRRSGCADRSARR